MSKAMDILRDRAKEQADITAQQLATTRQQLIEANNKLKLLEDYQDEHQEKNQKMSQNNGFTGFQLQNQNAFSQKIANAINLQKKNIEVIKETENQQFTTWQLALKEQKKYEAVIEREKKRMMARAEKIEQKMNDEFAARIHRVHASGGSL